jgi:hypothetical protein
LGKNRRTEVVQNVIQHDAAHPSALQLFVLPGASVP